MNKIIHKVNFIILNTFSYFLLGLNCIKALLIQNTFFNKELAYTFIWYKSVGVHSFAKSKFLYTDFFKILKPFHFLPIAYYFPTLINQKLINFLSVFVILIYAIFNNDYIVLGFVASPLFAIYFLAESKPERIFFAILWISLLFNDTLIAHLIFPISLFSVTTLVTNFGYIFFFIDSMMGMYWLIACVIFIIYLLLKGQKFSNLRWVLGIIKDPTLKEKTSFISRFKYNASKAHIITLGILLLILLNENKVYVSAAIFIIAINNVVVRFMDSSTERRVFMTVLLTYYLQTQDWQIFFLGLFLPFNLFSSIPKKNFDQAKLSNIYCMIKLLKKYRDRFTSNSMTLVEHTGDYEMDNKARYIWYLYEYAYINKTNIFPHVYLNEIRKTVEWMIYRNLNYGELSPKKKEFIEKFDYAISYSTKFAKLLSDQNFKPMGIIEHKCLNDFNIEKVTIWEKKNT